MNTDTVVSIQRIGPTRPETAAVPPAAGRDSPESAQYAVSMRQDIAAADGKDSPRQAGTERRLDDALREVNSYVQQVNRRIQFSPDERLPLGRTVIRVVDAETNEVIREIPSEELLAMARRISEMMQDGGGDPGGLIIEDRV